MRVCMIVQHPATKGGIAAVVNGYRGSTLEQDVSIEYVEAYRDGTKLQKLVKALGGYCRYGWVLLVRRPDLVHIHSSFMPDFIRSIPFIYLAHFARIPVINHIHDSAFEAFYTNAREGRKALIRHIYRLCDRLIALSQEWKDRLSEIVAADRISVLHNYSTLHPEALADRSQRESNHTVLFLGVIRQWKGAYHLPEIIRLTVDKVPDACFVIAGDGDIKGVSQRINEMGLSRHALFPGWIRGEAKDAALREADVFLLPSLNECMPMSVLDAMGYGLPVVSTLVGGIPQIVRQACNGYLFDPADVAGMAASIVTLLQNPSHACQLGRHSMNIVAEGFSLPEHVRLLQEIYVAAVGQKP